MTDNVALDRRNITTQKTPHTRLLDMLAGWSEFVQKDEASGLGDAEGVTERIADLYQEAGNLQGGDSEEVLRGFLLGRVLPVLARHSEANRQASGAASPL